MILKIILNLKIEKLNKLLVNLNKVNSIIVIKYHDIKIIIKIVSL